METKKPKLLITASTFPRYHGDKLPMFVYGFAQSLLPRYEIHILAPHYKGAKFFEDFDGLKVYRFLYALPALEKIAYGGGIMNNLRKNYLLVLLLPFYGLGQMMWMCYLLARHRYPLVNVHWFIPTGFLAAFIKPIFRFKMVLTSHGGDVWGIRNHGIIKLLPINFFFKLAVTSAEQLTVVSNAIRQQVLKKWGHLPNMTDRVHFVPMGINFAKFHKRDRVLSDNLQKPLRVIFVGRLAYEKGLEWLIKAIKELTAETQAKLTVVGDGVEREKIERLVQELELEDSVKFLGFVNNDEVPELLYENDIYVSSSLQEGLPTAHMEAMATGIAVVTTNTEGIEALVQDGVNGLVVPRKNSTVIAKAILRLAKEPGLAAKLSQNAVVTAKEFDWQNIADKFHAIFQKA